MIRKESDLPYNIYLTGFMGTGKSAAAQYLRTEFPAEMIDMDMEIAKRESKSIPEIFKTYGEDRFRELETELLRDISKEKGLVVSCGGGVPLRLQNVELMKQNGRIILLTASADTIFQRVRTDSGRPLLRAGFDTEYIRTMLQSRQPYYDHAADITISTEGRSVEEVCQTLILELKRMDTENV